MPLLGEEGNTENTETVVPPMGGIDQGQQAILNALQSRQPANTVNVSDFRPENSAMGALHESDYFPGINTPIQTGNYSGSIVGNNPIYTPTNYVPFGLMDARDAAIHKAALQKQMEATDFLKRHANPVTKHVAVQEELTKGYQDFLGNSVSRAKRTYGKNWAAALNQDPDFNRVNQNFQDRAKFHDAIVEHAAQLDLLDKDPNMVILPDTKKAGADLLSGAAYHGNDPFSEEGQNIGKKYLGAKGMMDLDVGINTLVSKMIPNITEDQLGAIGREGTERILTDVKTKQFSPEAQNKMAEDFAMQSGYPKKLVLEHIQAIQDKQVELKRHLWDAYHAPRENAHDDYSNVKPREGQTFNATSVTEKGPDGHPVTHQIPVTNSYNLGANDSKVELSMPITNQMHDVDGKPVNVKAGSVTGKVSSYGVTYYDSFKGKFLSKEEVDQKTKDGTLFDHPGINAKPVAFLNVSKSGDEEDLPTGQTITVPVGEIKGKFKGKAIDEKITEVENKAHQDNETIKQQKVKAADKAVTPAKSDYSKDIQTKIEKVMAANPGASEEDVIAAMKKGGHIK